MVNEIAFIQQNFEFRSNLPLSFFLISRPRFHTRMVCTICHEYIEPWETSHYLLLGGGGGRRISIVSQWHLPIPPMFWSMKYSMKSFNVDECHNEWRRADARNVSSESLYGSQLTLSTKLIEPNYLLLPTQHHSLFRNWSPLFPPFLSTNNNWSCVPLPIKSSNPPCNEELQVSQERKYNPSQFSLFSVLPLLSFGV